MLRELKTNPHRIVGMSIVNKKDTILMETEKGMIEEVQVDAIRFNDRYSNGSFVIDETEAGKVIAMWHSKPLNAE
jgi:topoisomerase-4 subunit A